MPENATITAELFTIPVEDKFLVYAPLQRSAFVTGAGTVNRIAQLHSHAAAEVAPSDERLIEFLRSLGIADGPPEAPPVTPFTGVPKPTTVTLFLTTSCNLRCTYCYASAGETPRQVMSLDVAKRGIDFVVQNALELNSPTIEVCFHGGGEPTVAWDTLVGSYDYAKRLAESHGIELKSSCASNGVLSESKTEWIIEHLDGVSLSFDGLPDVHDRNRLTISGEGSSEAVIRTIRRFDDAQFNYGLRLTITRDLISRIADSIRFILQNFEPHRIQVEPAYQLGRWREAPSAETSDFIASYREAQQVARTFGKQIEFSAARVGLLSNHFCGVTQDNFCLTAKGTVSGCYESFLENTPNAELFQYGRFDSDAKAFRFSLPVLNNLRDQTVDKHPFCNGCFAKWSCGGDCYHKAVAVTGSTEFAGSDRCHIIRELTQDQILTRIADAGGAFWHEEDFSSQPASGKEFLL